MSSEAPPIYDVSIFIPSYWADQISSGFDKAYADTHYLKFPIGQGTEFIPDLVVSGSTTLASTSASSLNVSGTTTLGTTSASSLNMGGGNITNVTNINGSAYPQGLDAVLSAGNTANGESLYMRNTDNLSMNGDQIRLEDFYTGGINTTLINTTISVNNLNQTTSLQAGTLTMVDEILTPTINKAELTPTDLTITGSSASITNTLTALSNIITDATATLTSGIISNIATFKALASSPSGNSTTITPNSIINRTADNATTTNISTLTGSGLTVVGSGTSITNTMTALTNIIADGTRTVTVGMVSSIATLKALAGTAGNSTVITPTDVSVYSVDSSTSSTYGRITNGGFNFVLSGTTDRVNVLNLMSGSGVTGLKLSTNQTTNYPFSANTISLENTGNAVTGGNSIAFRRNNTGSFVNSVGDTLGVLCFTGKNTTSAELEFARISSTIRKVGTNLGDGAILFQTAVNSVLATRFEINGDEEQINAFQPLDMNNNAIVSSTGGITLNATGSSGTGVITLNTKDGTAASGTGLVLTGNTLTLSTSAPNVQAPAHLCLYLPDPLTGISTLYKIQLLT